MKPFENINKPVVSHKRGHLEQDDQKSVDFIRKAIPIICQSMKIGFSDPMRSESGKN